MAGVPGFIFDHEDSGHLGLEEQMARVLQSIPGAAKHNPRLHTFRMLLCDREI